MDGFHWINTYYDGEARPLQNDSARMIFQRRCPTLYQEYTQGLDDGKIRQMT